MISDILNVYGNTLNFRGLSGRKTFITFLFYYILVFATASAFTEQINSVLEGVPFLLFLIPILYVWTFIAYTALCVRRIRDTGKSPLFIFVPFYNFYLLFKKVD